MSVDVAHQRALCNFSVGRTDVWNTMYSNQLIRESGVNKQMLWKSVYASCVRKKKKMKISAIFLKDHVFKSPNIDSLKSPLLVRLYTIMFKFFPPCSPQFLCNPFLANLREYKFFQIFMNIQAQSSQNSCVWRL